MADDKGTEAVSQAIINDEKLTKGEGAQDQRRAVEGQVMRRDSSNLIQKDIMSSKMEGGRIVYRIGGVEVTKEAYFAALHPKH